ncbi:hypothetical protein PLICRDRAFT_87084 [Plicaturopsis crispa FD-325 SS-3]|nr:hypothetical protein PLICRDRAFT_87084 [Plicaturopsis crispa FD-325 SS-3]
MGLSGRKEKQRIPNDPRNLAWADDAAKFGQSYLSKLGWDPSKGLGATGEGRTSALSVNQKLDMLGIGANRRGEVDGGSWKQNREFEELLKRLNANVSTPPVVDTEMEKAGGEEPEAGVGAKDRKRRKTEDNDEAAEKKDRKKHKKSKDGPQKREDETASDSKPEAVVEAVVAVTSRPMRHTHRTHRARLIASKKMASTSATAMAEILGIAAPPSASPSTSTSTSTPHTPKLTDLGESATLEKLTTSTKSVADYFKERLLAKSASASASPSPSGTSAPQIDAEPPRAGLGSSRLRNEVSSMEEDAPKAGLGSGNKFAAMLGGFVPPSTSSAPAAAAPTPPPDSAEDHATPEKPSKRSKSKSTSEVDSPDLDAKKARKEKRRREKHTLAASSSDLPTSASADPDVDDPPSEKAVDRKEKRTKEEKEARRAAKAERRARRKGEAADAGTSD